LSSLVPSCRGWFLSLVVCFIVDVDHESAPLGLVKTVIDEGRVLWGGDEALDYLRRRYLVYLDANDMEELISLP